MDGSTGYLLPPAATIPTTETTPAISIWFKTSKADGVLVSVQNQALSVGSSIGGGYTPVMYVGTDGTLYAQWWTGSVKTITSLNAVDDGLWHHAVLSTSGTTQTFSLDGVSQGTLSGTVSFPFSPVTNLTLGAGYIGGNWPNEIHHQQNGNSGYRDYFNGQIANITFTQ